MKCGLLFFKIEEHLSHISIRALLCKAEEGRKSIRLQEFWGRKQFKERAS